MLGMHWKKPYTIGIIILLIIAVTTAGIIGYRRKIQVKKTTPPVTEEAKPEIKEEPPLVVQNDQEVSGIFDKCLREFKSDEYDRVTCLLPYFEAVTLKDGSKVALAKAEDLKIHAQINDCHLPAHIIGQTNYKKFKDIGKAFADCPLGCFEGCYHGVVEGFSDGAGDVDALVTNSNIPPVCNSFGDNRKFQLHCVHGIGHGLMRHGIGQLSEKIDVCRRITGDGFRSGCTSGVIMEYVNSYLVLTEKQLKDAIPHMCDTFQQDQYKDLMWLCVQEIADGVMAYTANVAKANQYCNLVSPDLIDQCKADVAGSRHNPNVKMDHAQEEESHLNLNH